MVVEYDMRKPVDPFQKTNPVFLIIIAVVVILLIIIAARYIGKKQEQHVQEPVPEEAQQEAQQTPVVQPSPAPVPQAEPQKPLTPQDLQDPDFSSQDVKLPTVA